MRCYKSHKSLLSKVFLAVMILISIWVLFQHLNGQRNEPLESIIGIAFLMILLISAFSVSKLQINCVEKEIYIIGWFGLRKKVINFSDIKDIFVNYGGIDNHHSIMVETKFRNIKVFERGGLNEEKVLSEVKSIYSELSSFLGIEQKDFINID